MRGHITSSRISRPRPQPARSPGRARPRRGCTRDPDKRGCVVRIRLGSRFGPGQGLHRFGSARNPRPQRAGRFVGTERGVASACVPRSDQLACRRWRRVRLGRRRARRRNHDGARCVRRWRSVGVPQAPRRVTARFDQLSGHDGWARRGGPTSLSALVLILKRSSPAASRSGGFAYAAPAGGNSPAAATAVSDGEKLPSKRPG